MNQDDLKNRSKDTSSVPRGKKRLQLNVTEELFARADALATHYGEPLPRFVERILASAVAQGEQMRELERKQREQNK